MVGPVPIYSKIIDLFFHIFFLFINSFPIHFFSFAFFCFYSFLFFIFPFIMFSSLHYFSFSLLFLIYQFSLKFYHYCINSFINTFQTIPFHLLFFTYCFDTWCNSLLHHTFLGVEVVFNYEFVFLLHICVQINSGPKKIKVQTNFMSKKMLDPQKFGS